MSQIQAGLLAILLSAVAAWGVYSTIKYKKLNTDLTTQLQASQDELASTNKKLILTTADLDKSLSAINRQNDAIVLLQNKLVAADKARLAAETKSAEVKVEYRERVRVIYAETAPANCAEALTWLVDKVKEVVK
jgi:uncharacterized protein YjcR